MKKRGSLDRPVKRLTQLQSLNLSRCGALEDDGIAYLTGLTQLRSLNLRGCSEITDAGIANLKGLTQLRSLDLGHCSAIADTAALTQSSALLGDHRQRHRTPEGPDAAEDQTYLWLSDNSSVAE